jgi:hypothetical protein
MKPIRGTRYPSDAAQRRPTLADLLPARPSIAQYRQNGDRRFLWCPPEDGCQEAMMPSCLSRYVDYYRHHATVFARYCAEHRCNPRQLRLIEALYIEGISLREFARREGVAPQAISARINALAQKAPEFYRWWRTLNHGRRRTRPRPRCA